MFVRHLFVPLLLASVATLALPQTAAAQPGSAEAAEEPESTEPPDGSSAAAETASEDEGESLAENTEEQPVAGDPESEVTADPAEVTPTSSPTETPVETNAEATEAPQQPNKKASSIDRALSATEAAIPDRFVLWEDEELKAFIKPIVWVSAGLVGYLQRSAAQPDLSNRVSTLTNARIGFEGAVTEHVTFKSEFERNLGFSVTRGGPIGTSVWEGTGSFQARENFIRLEKWGLSLAGGIVSDPASVDYISVNTLDQFGMDPYVRDPLLFSGFNQGQGFLLRYTRWGATLGFGYSSGNPLISSLAAGFGGNVSSLGTLFTAPLRTLSNGIPGSSIQMQTLSPSLSFNHEIFDIKTALQYYIVDVDLTQATDQSLNGYNFRTTARLKLLDDMLSFFGTFSYRKNQQLAVPDITTRLPQDFRGIVVAGGADFNYKNIWGIGGGYYFVESRSSSLNTITNEYLNIGATYWLVDSILSFGARYARSMADTGTTGLQLTDTDSFIFSMRMLI